MKMISLAGIFLISAFLLSGSSSGQVQSDPLSPPASQTQPNQPGHVQSPTTSMQDSSGAPGDTGQQMRDKMFVRRAMEGGLAEIEMGKLAVQKSLSEDVKSFGQKMADEHSRMNEEMAEVADSIGLKIPRKTGKEAQAEYDKLSSLSGDEFDREYVAFMVKDHHADLREFRMASSRTQDTALKTAADNGSKMIREHMAMADKMAEQRNIPIPGRGPKPDSGSSASSPH
jgi:putative membrane protein